MGLRGPAPKSAEQRLYEGSAAHRPLPAPRPQYPEGAPERPKGMAAAARRFWDAYIERTPPGIIRLVDVFALARLCQDQAELQELAKGRRQIVAEQKREARAKGEPLIAASTVFAMTHEGRRLTATMNALKSQISRQELQFGLTPIAGQRLESGGIPLPMPTGAIDPVEESLCG